MSQEQEYTELDTMEKGSEEESGYGRNPSFINVFIPMLALLTIVICTVMLVLVVNLNKKVEGLQSSVMALQEMKQEVYENIPEPGSEAVNESETVDITEVVNLAEAAVVHEHDVLNDSRGRSLGIKRVYLTFDDGPSSNTDKILDILDEYGVKATFFVVGKEGYAEQYRRIAEGGHTLGMHSYSHKYNEIYASVDAYGQDLTKLHDFLYEMTGEDCNIVRFPGGSSNTISKIDMHELAAYLDEKGMVYFDWNVSSGDATGKRKSVNQIVGNVLDNVDKFDNAVILFHDAPGKGTTVEALPVIIEKILESEDTVILPISEDTARVQHLH